MDLRKKPPKGRVYRLSVCLASVTALAFVYLLDYTSPPSITFIFAYFLVVAFVAFKEDGWFSWAFAFFAALLRTSEMAEAFPIDEQWTHHNLGLDARVLWTFLNAFGIFASTVYLVHRQLRYIDRIKHTAMCDPLTKLPNRRSFQHELESAVAHCKRHKTPLSVAYIDVDNFKAVNDERGHKAGDFVLSCVADTIRELLRLDDHSGRLGGDEFAIIFTNTDEHEVRHTIERIKSVLDKRMAQHRYDVTFSIGVVTLKGHSPIEANALLHDADQIMYGVKRDTKNSIAYTVMD